MRAMGSHEAPLRAMKGHGTPWRGMKDYGTPWKAKEDHDCHGSLFRSMEGLGIPDGHGRPYINIEGHGGPRNNEEVHGAPWRIMKSIGP